MTDSTLRSAHRQSFIRVSQDSLHLLDTQYLHLHYCEWLRPKAFNHLDAETAVKILPFLKTQIHRKRDS